jgi:hypothetical protein
VSGAAPDELGEAAGHDQPSRGAVFLVLRHLENRVDRLLFGRIDEGARVDHEHIGRLGIACQFVPGVLRQSEHDFRVHEILGAAERDEADLHLWKSIIVA